MTAPGNSRRRAAACSVGLVSAVGTWAALPRAFLPAAGADIAASARANAREGGVPLRPQLGRGPPATSAAAGGAPSALAAATLLGGLAAGLLSRGPSSAASRQGLVARRAQSPADVNYMALLVKGDLPKRILVVVVLLALARIGYYVPLYGFDADACGEYFSRQASSGSLGFVDQLFGGGLGRVSLFSLGIGPYITSSIIFQILTTVTPQLKSLAQGEEGEAGRDKYKNYIKQVSFLFALLQGFGQSTTLAPFVFDNGPLWSAQVTLQFAIGAMITLFIADTITEQKLGNGSSLLIFSSIVANLPRTVASTAAKAADAEAGNVAAGIFALSLLVTILGLVFVLGAERRIPILFAKRLQDEASGQGGSNDAGESYLPIKLNASGVLPIIFAGSLLSLPALAANYTRAPWLTPLAQSVLPGSQAYIPLSMLLIAIFSYVSTFQVLDPKDMAQNLRKQAAAIPQVRPGKETEEYIRGVLERQSVFGAIILATLFVLPNIIEKATGLSTPNSFGGTSLLILVGVAADTWRQLQAELLMQQYATDVDAFYKGKRGN